MSVCVTYMHTNIIITYTFRYTCKYIEEFLFLTTKLRLLAHWSHCSVSLEQKLLFHFHTLFKHQSYYFTLLWHILHKTVILYPSVYICMVVKMWTIDKSERETVWLVTELYACLSEWYILLGRATRILCFYTRQIKYTARMGIYIV